MHYNDYTSLPLKQITGVILFMSNFRETEHPSSATALFLESKKQA